MHCSCDSVPSLKCHYIDLESRYKISKGIVYKNGFEFAKIISISQNKRKAYLVCEVIIPNRYYHGMQIEIEVIVTKP